MLSILNVGIAVSFTITAPEPPLPPVLSVGALTLKPPPPPPLPVYAAPLVAGCFPSSQPPASTLVLNPLPLPPI